jgi:predicted nucleic acid-binding protein
MIALAAPGRADHLVAGDKRAGLPGLGRVGATRILTAAEFCAEAPQPPCGATPR